MSISNVAPLAQDCRNPILPNFHDGTNLDWGKSRLTVGSKPAVLVLRLAPDRSVCLIGECSAAARQICEPLRCAYHAVESTGAGRSSRLMISTKREMLVPQFGPWKNLVRGDALCHRACYPSSHPAQSPQSTFGRSATGLCPARGIARRPGGTSGAIALTAKARR